MEVLGRKIINLLAFKPISKLEYILQHASPKLKRIILGHVNHEMAKRRRKKVLVKRKKRQLPQKVSPRLRETKLGRYEPEERRSKKKIFHEDRKVKKVIKFSTHSCLTERCVRVIVRKPGRMLFRKRSRKFMMKLEMRSAKRKKFDMRRKALKEIENHAKFLPDKRVPGLPYIPEKRDFVTKTKDKIFSQSKRKKSLKSTRLTTVRKRRKRKNKRKLRSEKFVGEEFNNSMPIGNWKIVIEDKSSENIQKMSTEGSLSSKKVVENLGSSSFMFNNIKTPTDRWKMVQAALGDVKTWNKKFPKGKMRTQDKNKTKQEDSTEDDPVQKFITQETDKRFREAFFSKISNSNSGRKSFLNKKNIGISGNRPQLTHISPPDSPVEVPIYSYKFPSKKKKDEQIFDSDLLNEILSLQSSCMNISSRPPLKKKKLSAKPRRNIKRKGKKKRKQSENFNPQDLLVAVNRNTAFWYELTSRTQNPSAALQKHFMAAPNDTSPESGRSSSDIPKLTTAKLSPKPSRPHSAEMRDKLAKVIDIIFPETNPLKKQEDEFPVVGHPLDNWKKIIKKQRIVDRKKTSIMVNIHSISIETIPRKILSKHCVK